MIHFEKNPTDKTGFCELKLSFDKNEMLRNLEYFSLFAKLASYEIIEKFV